MPMHEEPVVHAFYEDEDHRTFEVTAFDENDGTIKVLYDDNTAKEFDLDDWYGMDLERVETDDDEDDDIEETDDADSLDDDVDLDEGDDDE